MAPRRLRGRYTGLMFVMASIGSALGIWLGLLLTTPSAPWPDGLAVAQASASFDDGWRWIYGIGAVLALFSLLLRFALPESPRWLVSRGHTAEAEVVVGQMHRLATRQHDLLPPDPAEVDVTTEQTAPTGTRAAVTELLRSRHYLSRLALLSLSWMLAYAPSTPSPAPSRRCSSGWATRWRQRGWSLPSVWSASSPPRSWPGP